MNFIISCNSSLFSSPRNLVIRIEYLQGISVIISIFAFFAFLVCGAATDFLKVLIALKHSEPKIFVCEIFFCKILHTENKGLREIYDSYGLDPDDEYGKYFFEKYSFEFSMSSFENRKLSKHRRKKFGENFWEVEKYECGNKNETEEEKMVKYQHWTNTNQLSHEKSKFDVFELPMQ